MIGPRSGSPWTNAACGQLAGLRIAESPLGPTARPIAAIFAPFFDVNWDAEYQIDGTAALPFADVELAPLTRRDGADISLSLSYNGKTLTTVTYAIDGQLMRAPGEFSRRGRSEALADRLQRHPISVFFSDGSVMLPARRESGTEGLGHDQAGPAETSGHRCGLVEQRAKCREPGGPQDAAGSRRLPQGWSRQTAGTVAHRCRRERLGGSRQSRAAVTDQLVVG
jgi:hypothetical protein